MADDAAPKKKRHWVQRFLLGSGVSGLLVAASVNFISAYGIAKARANKKDIPLIEAVNGPAGYFAAMGTLKATAAVVLFATARRRRRLRKERSTEDLVVLFAQNIAPEKRELDKLYAHNKKLGWRSVTFCNKGVEIPYAAPEPAL